MWGAIISAVASLAGAIFGGIAKRRAARRSSKGLGRTTITLFTRLRLFC